MDEVDKKILRALQDGIPVTEEPFAEIARTVGISQHEAIARLKKLRENGGIRRFKVFIDPQKVGIVSALVSWKVPGNIVEEVGRSLSKYEEITHCYERRIVPKKWEYNLYAVIHGRSVESCMRFVDQLSKTFGLKEHVVLFSTKQLKEINVGSLITI